MANIINPPAPGVPYYTPAQYPAAGTAVEDGSPLPTLFKPIQIRGVEFHNRIWVSSEHTCEADQLCIHEIVQKNAGDLPHLVAGLPDVPIFSRQWETHRLAHGAP